MSHYFSEKQDVKSDRKIIKYKIENKKFEFLTDNGVFSKTKVDFGTDIMLKVFLRENINKKNQKFDVLDIGCGYGGVSVVVKSFFKIYSSFLSFVFIIFVISPFISFKFKVLSSVFLKSLLRVEAERLKE